MIILTAYGLVGILYVCFSHMHAKHQWHQISVGGCLTVMQYYS